MAQSPDYRRILGGVTFVFLIVVPILTMRFSEESRHKTDQLLLTSPLRITDIVLGKYFAALTVFCLGVFVTMLHPLLLSVAGTVVVSEIISAYIGFFLLGAACIAVGVFVSSLTQNQVISAVVTFALLLLMWILDYLQEGIPGDRISGVILAAIMVAGTALFVYFSIRHLLVSMLLAIAGGGLVLFLFIASPGAFDGLIIRILQWFSLLTRYQDFTLGVLKLSPIVYFLSFSAVFLYLTVRVIDKRRWK